MVESIEEGGIPRQGMAPPQDGLEVVRQTMVIGLPGVRTPARAEVLESQTGVGTVAGVHGNAGPGLLPGWLVKVHEGVFSCHF